MVSLIWEPISLVHPQRLPRPRQIRPHLPLRPQILRPPRLPLHHPRLVTSPSGLQRRPTMVQVEQASFSGLQQAPAVEMYWSPTSLSVPLGSRLLLPRVG